jgi:hypothetical protein
LAYSKVHRTSQIVRTTYVWTYNLFV